MSPSRPIFALVVALVVAFAIPITTWFWLYPTLGYGPATLLLAQASVLVAAAVLVATIGPRWGDLGLGPRSLLAAVAIAAAGYVAIIVVAAGLNAAFDAGFTLFRSRYEAAAFVDNWLLTAFAEELLFAGVLFGLVRRLVDRRRLWLAVVVVAVAFALWHLPGYLAVGYGAGPTAGRLALNLASWLVFGSIYALSGNLWLVVVAHAATDYGLSPLVTNEPLFGLLFMAILIAGARWSRRPARSERPERAAESDPPPSL
ncbi:MAG: CPBP family glutamic-type intramembrane protease [Trueperaceae bacterium]